MLNRQAKMTNQVVMQNGVKKFEERGALPVVDGTYLDVIITIRSAANGSINCFVGKCEVKDSKVSSMFMKLEDGKYELIQRKPK